MLARVRKSMHTTSSPVRERETQRERETKRDKERRNDGCLGTF